MTCLEEISGSGGSNSLRDKYENDNKHRKSSISIFFFRCRNLDQNYFKRWLLRETPEEKMDIKLLQTFKKINMQSAMKLHDTSKGLVPTVSTPNIHALASGNNMRRENTFSNFAQLLAAKFVKFYSI